MGHSPLEALESLFHWLDRGGTLPAERAENACRVGRPRAAYAVAEPGWEAAEHAPHAMSIRDILRRRKLVDLLARRGALWKEKRLEET